MKTRGRIAVEKFMGGYNCAQSVFTAFSDELPIGKDLALKTACGFGAGMGRKEEVCGAVTGGIMVLGAMYGRGEAGDRAATETTYARVRAFMDRFGEKNGTIICRKLLRDCDLLTDAGQRYYLEHDLFHTVCVPCVRSAVEILEHVMSQP